MLLQLFREQREFVKQETKQNSSLRLRATIWGATKLRQVLLSFVEGEKNLSLVFRDSHKNIFLQFRSFERA